MIPNIKKTEPKDCNTTLIADLIEKLKFLAVKEDACVNDLIEEAIQDLIKKHEHKEPEPKASKG